MATITKGRTFVSGEVVTPTKLNTLVDSATVSGIVTADIGDAQITTAKIADSNVTTAKIADSNVTTAKIADGAVTSAKLNSSVILVPTGAVMPFAMNTAPTGWLAANGAAVSRTTYAILFAAIGTTYGSGDGSTTFTLPDLRGYFLRGAGTNSDGTAAGTFGSKQADGIKDHTHSVKYNSPGAWGGNGGGMLTLQSTGSNAFNYSMTAGTSAEETRPKNIAMLYCIKT
jgi:microcystin-dependent protein